MKNANKNRLYNQKNGSSFFTLLLYLNQKRFTHKIIIDIQQ